ncbi:restriction endonuclease subunit S [Paenibacillus rhizolycopersici]|uniref:restriction endonuclease subunit S n=1 Tax=Paenibacillus rhizolycopersici TaxID=2780073 RepID=UPI003D2E4124
MSYAQYRTLGELWLNSIPEHWDSHKIKYVFSERSEKGYPDEPLLVASQNMGVVPKKVYGNRTVEATKDLHNLKLVRIGDFVISLRSFQGGLEYAYYQGIISPAYIVMKPSEYIATGYFKYLAKSRLFIELLQMCVTGIREGQNIDYGKLKNHHIPLPPLTEQNQIVRFLDWKVSQINRLINAKKKQIGLLQEQKRAVVNEAVTKGLKFNAPRKNSGVDWLGDLPDHWEVCPSKYLFDERNERSESGEETHLSMSQKYGLIPDTQLNERRMLSESYVGGKLCYENDLVLNRLKAHLGVFSLAPQMGVVSPDYTILKVNTKKIIPDFAQHILHCESCRPELRIRVKGVVEGFWRLYTEDFNTIKLPLPSIEEQKEILAYIYAYSEKSNLLISSLETEIALLHEYRTRLISDVVTGNKDVRSVEVPDFEVEVEENEAFSDEYEESEVDE